jgi:hypothetical protein
VNLIYKVKKSHYNDVRTKRDIFGAGPKYNPKALLASHSCNALLSIQQKENQSRQQKSLSRPVIFEDYMFRRYCPPTSYSA